MKYAAVLSALLMVAANSHALKAQEPIAFNTRPLIYRADVRANTDMTYRSAARKCYSEGIADVAREMRISPFEEEWAFLPSICEWHEIADSEKGGLPDTVQLRTDKEYLEQLLENHNEIKLVHVHLRKYFSENYLTNPTASDIQRGLPSPGDLLGVIKVEARYNLDSRKTILHEATTPYGVVQYSLTEKGIATARAIGPHGFDTEEHSNMDFSLILGVFIKLGMGYGGEINKIPLLLEQEKNPQKALTEMAKRIEDLGLFKINYRFNPTEVALNFGFSPF